MFETLDRTVTDPSREVPRVEAFVGSGLVTLYWTGDEGADEYILERAKDAVSLSYQMIYRGPELSYEDRDAIEGTRYLYRLSKRRGDKTFGPWETSLGVRSLIIRDGYEINNTSETAVHLETLSLIANMYFYRSYNGATLRDEDWYSVDVPPQRRLSVVVSDSLIGTGGLPSHFMYYILGATGDEVIHEDAFWIFNTTTQQKRFYFMLYPNETLFAGSSAGGQIISYTIQVKTIEPY
jgi:hypothetical protein